MSEYDGLVAGLIVGLIAGIPIGWFAAQFFTGLQSPQLSTSQSNSKVENVEEIVWTDWKGRERKMIIHREVK